jgi:Escherichia/Staphylococcus phage prohead protease
MDYTKAFDFDVKNLEEAGTFEGYASVFGGPPDLQSDIVRHGAFTNTLAQSKGKVPILMGHIVARIVGFGTHAEEDGKGLLVRGEFTLESDEGRNAYATAKHAQKCGHKLGLSIGYAIRPGGAEFNDKTGIRTLLDLDLYEYSLAAVPAAPRARMRAVKSEWTERQFEEYLRDAGLSREAAKRFILGGYGAIGDRREAGNDAETKAGTSVVSELLAKSILHEMRKGL